MRRRLDAGLIMQAADDVLVTTQKPEKQDEIYHATTRGKSDYNLDEWIIGRDATEEIIAREM